MFTLADLLLIGVVTAMAVAIRLLLPAEELIAPRGYVIALVAGWAMYLPIFLLLLARQRTQRIR